MKTRVGWMLTFFFIALGTGYAEQSPPPLARPAIPFKTEPTPLEDNGPRVGGAMLALTALALGGFYLLRKRLPGLQALQLQNKRLRVVERLRLTPRTTVYLLELDQKEILIGHSGDRLVRLDDAVTASSRAAGSGN